MTQMTKDMKVRQILRRQFRRKKFTSREVYNALLDSGWHYVDSPMAVGRYLTSHNMVTCVGIDERKRGVYRMLKPGEIPVFPKELKCQT